MRPFARHLAVIAGTLALLGACGSADRAGVEPVADAPVALAPPAPVHRPSPASAEAPVTPQASQPAPVGAVLVNQHGYALNGPKRGAHHSAATLPQAFLVFDDRGTIVFRGTTTPVAGVDPQSGQRVHQFDFSDLRVVGTGFTVSIGLTQSDPFDIGRPYQSLARDALGYFYQSRFAEPVEAPYVPAATPPLTRTVGHTDSRYTCFSGRDNRGTVWPGCSYELTVTDGWYDAGDYGQYAINTAWATWMMLNMAERDIKASRDTANFAQCAPVFPDQSLLMPEAGNGQSDLLDEARRGIDNLLSTQVTSTVPQAVARGSQAGGGPLSLSMVDASGMVHQKVHGIRWPGSSVTPATDDIPRRLYPPATAATLALAGVGAQCARVFERTDPAYAATCLSAARRAFAAAERVPDAYAWNVFDGGGPYDDPNVTDEFGWAATELWLATGEAQYAAAMERYVPTYNPYNGFDWRTVEVRGALSLALSARYVGRDSTPRHTLAEDAVLTRARFYVDQRGRSAFGIPYDDTNFYWGSNGQLMNRSLVLGAAHELDGDPQDSQGFEAAVYDAADYVLGRNPLGRSFVSGYGERPMLEPHHRFWRGNLDSTRPMPPPGVLSGGPNNTSFIDPVGSTLRGQCTGMTCWRDEWPAYSLNEVAINWNAGLAWTAHWLDRHAQRCSQPVRERPDAR